MTVTTALTCAADQTEHESLDALHKHVRYVLKLTQEQYYTRYAPRHDLGTGEVIPWKAPAERYLQAEFVDKNSLKRFCKEHPERGRDWAIEWLRKRRAEKQLIYPPCQAELRSLMCPSMHYYESIGGYNAICERLGYTVRFDGHLPADQLNVRQIITVDTREQDPLQLNHPTERGTLRCGDYGLTTTFACGAFHGGSEVYIERKSLTDFIGTLSDRVITRKGGHDSNLERFTRELERAEETHSYVVLLCEADINDALGFSYLLQFRNRGPLVYDPKTHKRERQYRGIQPEHVWKNLRDLMRRFTCFQPLFVNGREQAAAAVPRILAMARAVETVDLQWTYESGQLVLT